MKIYALRVNTFSIFFGEKNMYWFEEYIGKPWEAVPNPPQSFTCGHLGRWIYQQRLGVDTPLIWANPASLKECIRNVSDMALYDLFSISDGDRPRPFDVAALSRCKNLDHMGIAVNTVEGLRVLHCQQVIGVVLDSVGELMGTGFRHIIWHRHKNVSQELALCRA
jgi:hypothetical protein